MYIIIFLIAATSVWQRKGLVKDVNGREYYAVLNEANINLYKDKNSINDAQFDVLNLCIHNVLRKPKLILMRVNTNKTNHHNYYYI